MTTLDSQKKTYSNCTTPQLHRFLTISLVYFSRKQGYIGDIRSGEGVKRRKVDDSVIFVWYFSWISSNRHDSSIFCMNIGKMDYIKRRKRIDDSDIEVDWLLIENNRPAYSVTHSHARTFTKTHFQTTRTRDWPLIKSILCALDNDLHMNLVLMK